MLHSAYEYWLCFGQVWKTAQSSAMFVHSLCNRASCTVHININRVAHFQHRQNLDSALQSPERATVLISGHFTEHSDPSLQSESGCRVQLKNEIPTHSPAMKTTVKTSIHFDWSSSEQRQPWMCQLYKVLNLSCGALDSLPVATINLTKHNILKYSSVYYVTHLILPLALLADHPNRCSSS